MRLLRSKAVLLPGCEVVYSNEKTGETQTWKYEGGLREYLLSELRADPLVEPFEASGYADENTEGFAPGEGATWVLAWTTEGPLTRESYVNLIPTPQGGTHESGLKDGLFQAVKTFMEIHGLQTKGVKVLAEDVFGRANFVLSTKSLDPQFQGQTKEKLTSRDALKLVSNFVRTQFEFWLNDHIEDGKKLVEHIVSVAQARQRQASKYESARVRPWRCCPGNSPTAKRTTSPETNSSSSKGTRPVAPPRRVATRNSRRFFPCAGRFSTRGKSTRTNSSAPTRSTTLRLRSGSIRTRKRATPI